MGRDAATGDVGRRGAELALVTVTHNSMLELTRMLATVQRHLPEAEVVVVDCASGDDSAAAAREWQDGRATVLEPGVNLGYGRATNRGVAAVTRPVTVVANPDIELLDAALAALASEVARPGAPERILAPLVLRPDGSRQDSVHRHPTSPAALVRALLPPVALPHGLRTAVEPWRADKPHRVAWAVGCCLVARTDTLRRLGPFDERIFLYAEDTELGLRAADLGVETWFRPEARVRHDSAHSTAGAFGGEHRELLARQRRAVVQERLGPARRRIDDWLQLVTFADRVVLKTIAGQPRERELRQLAALRRARREPPRLV